METRAFGVFVLIWTDQWSAQRHDEEEACYTVALTPVAEGDTTADWESRRALASLGERWNDRAGVHPS